MRIADLVRPSVAVARGGLHVMVDASHLPALLGLGTIGQRERAAAWDALAPGAGHDSSVNAAPIESRR
jgi:hypothetical protein